jgi:Fe-S-cluster containining protein
MKKALSKDKAIPVGKYVLFPDNFSRSPCEMCGKCCNNDWSVEMDAEDFYRYKSILENSPLTDEYKSYLQETKNREGKIVYKLSPRKGRCIFLLSNNKCYIHSEHGSDAKSRTCKNYPLAANAFSPRGMYLKTSFVCPSILKTLLSSDPVRITEKEWGNDFLCPDTVNFSGDYHISWEKLFSLNDSLSSLFLQKPFHAEDNLITAGIWVFNLFNRLKQDRMNEFDSMCSKEYLAGNRASLLEAGNEFPPQQLEQMNLISHIAYAVMQEEFLGTSNRSNSLNITRMLEPEAVTSELYSKIRVTYNEYYIKELPGYSDIIEKYLLHKILSVGVFTQSGFVYGINLLSLCYSFIRLYLISDLVFEKDELNTDDILEAISFVELVFFHRRSMEYLKSPHIINILSNPALSILLLRL